MFGYSSLRNEDGRLKTGLSVLTRREIPPPSGPDASFLQQTRVSDETPRNIMARLAQLAQKITDVLVPGDGWKFIR